MPGRDEFLFDAGAFAVAGRVGRDHVSTGPTAALTPSGGISAAEVNGFTYGANLRIENARVNTVGSYDPETRRWSTISVAVLTGVNIFDVLLVDRVVSRLVALHSDSGEPAYSFIGSHFENLQIAGTPVEAALDLSRKQVPSSSREFTLTTLLNEVGGAPELTRPRNVFQIPGMGRLILGELLSGPDKLSLCMMRVEFDDEPVELELATVTIGSRRLSSPPIRGEKFDDVRRAQAPRRTVPPSDEEARSIAGLLLEGGRAAAYERSPAAREIYLADVEMNVDAFRNAGELLRSGKRGFPCLVAPWLREPIPVLTRLENSLLAAERFDQRARELKMAAYDSVLRYIEKQGMLDADRNSHIETLSVSDAGEYFGRGLEEFLSVRLSARRSNISASAGHVFTVHTQSLGLQICISPAYALTYGLTFGNALSTPVTQYVQPGRWIFGTPQLDSRFMYDIPLQDQAHIAR